MYLPADDVDARRRVTDAFLAYRDLCKTQLWDRCIWCRFVLSTPYLIYIVHGHSGRRATGYNSTNKVPLSRQCGTSSAAPYYSEMYWSLNYTRVNARHRGACSSLGGESQVESSIEETNVYSCHWLVIRRPRHAKFATLEGGIRPLGKSSSMFLQWHSLTRRFLDWQLAIGCKS